MQGRTRAKCITTSNMKEATQTDYVVNFASFASRNAEIIDNSGLMLLKVLAAAGVKEAAIAGMDGYSVHKESDYFDRQLEYDFSKEAKMRNDLISEEMQNIGRTVKLHFLTPTQYHVQ